jgi:hypothetical protein
MANIRLNSNKVTEHNYSSIFYIFNRNGVMRQTKLRLSEEDRSAIHEIRSKGLHHSREVNRAHVLACLDRSIPEAQIMAVLGIGRTAVWRARASYLQGGLELAVFDAARSGRPVQYGTDVRQKNGPNGVSRTTTRRGQAGL